MANSKVIDHFEIPVPLAQELSNLLIKQVIRERLLAQLIDDDEKYNKAEELLIPIVSKVEMIKVKITNEFVPEKYRSSNYSWNYNGYEVDENRLEILTAE